MWIKLLVVCLCFVRGDAFKHNRRPTLEQVFAWKQLTYEIDDVLYKNDTNAERRADVVNFDDDVTDAEKFFIQYNNVPIGFEKYGDKVFVTVPRRRYGIPSTLNYVELSAGPSPDLVPYPPARGLVSVYRPRVDACDRLWAVDTGMLEVPEGRVQVRPPSIVVFDLKTDQKVLEYQLPASVLVNERTPAGLTSIIVDVDPSCCDDAHAYINDLATEGLLVFSMRKMDSWRIQHESFKHDPGALNFTVDGNLINWKDGLFSVALVDDHEGRRMAYYHPLVSTKEFVIDTTYLKVKNSDFAGEIRELGSKGPLTQSGSHAYHTSTRTLFFANVARDAILCWKVGDVTDHVATVAQDHKKLVYISDLKVIGDEVWVLVNQIPNFVYSTLNPQANNFYVHKAKVRDLIRGTACEHTGPVWH